MHHFRLVVAVLLLTLWLTRYHCHARPLDDEDVKDNSFRRPFPIVQPVEGKTRLQVYEPGLDILRRIKHQVAPVVVIGPYRSGKSFLLNQLLGVSCDEGFGVGHTRSTQTKGVWIWGEPDFGDPRVDKAAARAVIYVDTEGFESTGKSDAYDDRIFALSALLSSVLVYNLPETVRESDVEKLSFAVQLARGFYADSQGGKEGAIEPGNMLWLIQRDFLEGKTVGQMVAEALQPVANPTNDPDIAQVNRIRTSLHVIAANSTAFGLAQPHLERTRLCALPDSELAPAYLRQRTELRALVHSLAQPKVINGEALHGAALAELVQSMVAALNARDIPTAGSILDHFNRDVVARTLESYIHDIEAMPLPAEAGDLESVQASALAKALHAFDAGKFGVSSSEEVRGARARLEAQCAREAEARRTLNTVQSEAQCAAAEAACQDVLEREQRGTLPSTGRFQAKFERCRGAFRRKCVGPARAAHEGRLQHAWQRELGRYRTAFNDQLLTGLIVISLAIVVVFRFVVRFALLETAGWLAFAFLQVYPRLRLGGSSMYETWWWVALVAVWETVVYNPLVDMESVWRVALPGVAVAWAAWRLYARCRPGRRRKSKHIQLTAGTRDLDI